MSTNKTIEITQSVPSKEEIGWVKELAGGASNEEVANKLGVNKNTFAFRVAQLRKKYNCNNTTALVYFFKKNNLI